MSLLKIAMMLVSLAAGALIWYLRKKEKKEFADLLLEGATLSEVPSFKELLYNPEAREAIKGHVVAIGYDPGFDHRDGMAKDSAPPDVYLVDDGGGVHSLDLRRASSINLETNAAELAALFGVEFRS